jgi:hypothetical protein
MSVEAWRGWPVGLGPGTLIKALESKEGKYEQA